MVYLSQAQGLLLIYDHWLPHPYHGVTRCGPHPSAVRTLCILLATPLRQHSSFGQFQQLTPLPRSAQDRPANNSPRRRRTTPSNDRNRRLSRKENQQRIQARRLRCLSHWPGRQHVTPVLANRPDSDRSGVMAIELVDNRGERIKLVLLMHSTI